MISGPIIPKSIKKTRDSILMSTFLNVINLLNDCAGLDKESCVLIACLHSCTKPETGTVQNNLKLLSLLIT